MLDKLSRIQLSIFAVVTVLTVGAISIFYLRVPEAIGLTSYQVTANFTAAGGLYENANVTYRGSRWVRSSRSVSATPASSRTCGSTAEHRCRTT